MMIPSRRNINGQGFTLAEVLITILIAGILSTIAIGSSQNILARERVNSLAVRLAGWLDQVRKASTLGAGCTATINKNIAPSSNIATTTLTAPSSTQIKSNHCGLALSATEISDVSSDQSNYTITSNILASDQTTLQFTPRGTLVLPANTNSINLVISLMPSGPKRCVSVKYLIADITISKGESCGAQERF